MNTTRAEEVLTRAFEKFSPEQFKNMASWLLRGKPILGGRVASDQWHMDGVP